VWLGVYDNACPAVVKNVTSARSVNYYEGVETPFSDITVNFQVAWRSPSHRAEWRRNRRSV